MRYTEYGIPCFGAVVPTAGVSAPFTLLGTLALTNAEVLAGLVLEQMVRPGRETIYCVLPTVTDIRTAGYAPGGIETGILTMACAQMARHYNIPSGGFAGQTNAKCNDAQSGFETSMSPLAAVMAGLDFNFLGGLLDAMMVFDYAKVVVDNEVALMLKKTANGIPVYNRRHGPGCNSRGWPGRHVYRYGPYSQAHANDALITSDRRPQQLETVGRRGQIRCAGESHAAST